MANKKAQPALKRNDFKAKPQKHARCMECNICLPQMIAADAPQTTLCPSCAKRLVDRLTPPQAAPVAPPVAQLAIATIESTADDVFYDRLRALVEDEPSDRLGTWPPEFIERFRHLYGRTQSALNAMKEEIYG